MYMDFNEFKQEFISCMELNKTDECTVCVKERLKNNGKILTGISFSHPKVKCVPTIYLEQMYEYYESGRGILEMVEDYVRLFEQAKTMRVPKLDYLSDFDDVKETLLCKVINTEMNKELLENVPHISFLNLSVVFFVNVPMEEGDNSFIMIDNNVFKCWCTDEKTAFEYAHRNTLKKYATSINSIEEVLFGFMGTNTNDEEREAIKNTLEDLEEDGHKHFMYVLSNSSRVYGAVGILDNNKLSEFAREIDDDFYILPSSVHELILVPKDNSCSKEELESMVCQVNETEVSPEDILSNNVYLFRRNTGKVCMA